MSNARALYNEVDKYAAQWLRNLIEAGLIAPGDVAECSIEDLTPNDIRGYTQFHAFAGIGIWSYALRQAGWPDTRPVWTMSCPCQPFSAAGKGAGFADERHLWPAGHWLIQQCRPAKVFGEQVKTAREWLDLVGSDLEALGYAFGAVAASSRAFGAPDDRNRLYWVADAEGLWCDSGEDHRAGLLQAVDVFSEPRDSRAAAVGTGGYWSVHQPPPLTVDHGDTSRVGRLRAYGNAINAVHAQAFIEAYLETEAERFRLTDVSLLSPAEDVFS